MGPLDYVCIIEKKSSGRPFLSGFSIFVTRDGKTERIGVVQSYEEAMMVAKQPDGLPIRDWKQCVQCGKVWPESFSVHNRVWHEAKLGKGLIHIGCLQDRLGRLLTPDDFDLSLPINEILAFGIQCKKV
jgi:hypothetical protein